jgi:hypothetical protein
MDGFARSNPRVGGETTAATAWPPNRLQRNSYRLSRPADYLPRRTMKRGRIEHE